MLDNPGTFTFTAAITVAASAIATASQSPGDGLDSVTIDLQFLYGSGGATVDAWVQVSLDGQQTYQDAVHHQFTTASARRQYNITTKTPVTAPVTPGDGVLATDSAIDGILGPDWRLKYTSTGTYAGTQLVARLIAR